MPQAYSNLIWLYSTFKSRATAESLLSPEHESGNLTTRDYDNAIRFLPGPHRRYPANGIATGFAAGFGLRLLNPRMSTLKQFLLVTVSALSGYFLGSGFQMFAHVQYLKNIEDFDGYKRAMNNVHKKVPGGYNGRMLQIALEDASPQPTSEHVDIPSESSPPLDTSSSTERPQSKWDQIRTANSRTAQNSTWDALRQREKIRVKPNPQERDDDKWTSDG